VALGVVAVEEILRGGPGDDLGQLPAEVHGVLDAGVEPLAAERRVDVGGVTGQQDPPIPVGGGLAGHVREPRDVGRVVGAEVRPVGQGELPAEEVERRLVGAAELALDQDGAVRTAARGGVLGADAAALPAHPQLRVLQLQLGDQPAGGGVPPGELDAGRLAHDAAAPVAADQVGRPKGGPVRQLDVDAGVVLGEADHVPRPQHGHAQLLDPAGEDPFDVALPQRQAVGAA
jgi:hypothetical protein